MVSPRLILIGPPGAGKTAVGRQVAERLGEPFVDTDHLVEQAAGASVADVFVLQGEPEFRRMEVDAVRAALGGPGVVALGGGAPMQQQVAELLAGLPVLLLDVTIADAAGRIGLDRPRPLLAVNPRATWTRMMNQRRPTYVALARWRVDTAGLDLPAVVEQVLAEIAA